MTRRTVPPLCASPIGRSLKKRSAKSLGLKSFAELTTPSAALRRLRAFLLMPHPPLLFKEGNVSALKQSVNSFTRSDALGYVRIDLRVRPDDNAIFVHDVNPNPAFTA